MNPEANLESFSFKALFVDKALIVNPDLDPDIHFFKDIISRTLSIFFHQKLKTT